jgi:hypothetical protein
MMCEQRTPAELAPGALTPSELAPDALKPSELALGALTLQDNWHAFSPGETLRLRRAEHELRKLEESQQQQQQQQQDQQDQQGRDEDEEEAALAVRASLICNAATAILARKGFARLVWYGRSASRLESDAAAMCCTGKSKPRPDSASRRRPLSAPLMKRDPPLLCHTSLSVEPMKDQSCTADDLPAPPVYDGTGFNPAGHSHAAARRPLPRKGSCSFRVRSNNHQEEQEQEEEEQVRANVSRPRQQSQLRPRSAKEARDLAGIPPQRVVGARSPKECAVKAGRQSKQHSTTAPLSHVGYHVHSKPKASGVYQSQVPIADTLASQSLNDWMMPHKTAIKAACQVSRQKAFREVYKLPGCGVASHNLHAWHLLHLKVQIPSLPPRSNGKRWRNPGARRKDYPDT